MHGNEMKTTRHVWAAAMMAAVAGCGGGGASPPPPPPAPATISGIVANGAAVAGAQVSARCAAGTASAVTDASGHYTMTLAGSAALPCVLETEPAGGTPLHGFALPGSANVTAHVTPVTELAVATYLHGSTDPATYYAAFDATAAAALTTTGANAAAQASAAILGDAGLPASDLAAPYSGPLTPGASTGYGAVLGLFDAFLGASGSTLAQLAAAFGQAAPGATPVPDGGSLPPAQLLNAPASNCASLRSGKYHVISPSFSSSVDDELDTITIDAAALTSTASDASVTTLTPDGTCRYTVDAGLPDQSDITVSKAGLILVRYLDTYDNRHRLSIAIPVQTHTLDEFAGRWNTITYEQTVESPATPSDTAYQGSGADYTVDATGHVGAGTVCEAFAGCVPITDTFTVTANADGAFDFNDVTGGWTERMFMFRTGAGSLLVVNIDQDGSVGFAVPYGNVVPPEVGASTTSWDFTLDTTNESTQALSTSSFTIQSFDATADTWVRTSNLDGHTDMIAGDSPMTGFVFRAAGSSLTTGGATFHYAEYTALRMRDAGLSLSWLPAFGRVDRPGTMFFSVYQ